MNSNALEVLNLVVKDCINKHEGGEVFFDNLDENIRKINIVDVLLEKIKEDCVFVVSGKFGRYFYQTYSNKFAILVVNGSLRKSDSKVEICDIFDFYGGVNDRDFIFIDDSFYSGKTRNKINEFLERFRSKIIHSYVVYDGSLIKQENVTSLYRYHQ